ncbi:MAG: hypothetical protein HYS12_13030 [Planctomycetes bacterium]|nr:hypothetical protein [Planctomycetota bacterium]
MKKLNVQQLLLEKGERIGLCVAGGLAFLLLVLTLFLPGKGLFSGTASGHSEELTKETVAVKSKHSEAKPTESDKPGSLKDATAEFQVRFVDPDLFRAFAMFFRPPTKDTKRQKPTILVPDEVQVAVIRGQFPALQFQTDESGKIIGVLVVVDEKSESSDANSSGSSRLQGNQITQSGAGSSNNMNNQFSRYNLQYRRFTPPKPRIKIEMRPINEIGGKKPAVGALPARIAVIVASFPYKQQIEEFKRALHKTSAGEVLTEHGRGDKGKPFKSFEFNGVEVERMTLKDDGSEGAWEPLDVEKDFKQFVIRTNKSLEKENDDPQFKQILEASKKLVMRVPAQLPEDLKKPEAKSADRKAPDLVANLKNIQASLAKLKESKTQEVTPPPTIASDEFSAYDVDGGAGTGKTNPATAFNPTDSGSGFGSFQVNSDWAKKNDDTPLEHCLVRFVDVTLEAGKIYKYRFKVKMMNPNYSPVPSERKDTYQHFAKDKVLTSQGWAYTGLVSVPPDQYVYALNLPEFGLKLNTEMRKQEPWRWNFYYPPGQDRNHAAVQIHRWVDSYSPEPTKASDQNVKAVGEWLVAARILVQRGEFVRDPEYKVPVPIKPTDLLEHELDSITKATRSQDKTLMPVDFGDETLLVDFEGGQEGYTKTEGSDETAKSVPVTDQCAVELLMMRPDGKMIARNSLTDSDTENSPLAKERVKRAEAFTARIEKLRGRGPKTENDPLKGNPK